MLGFFRRQTLEVEQLLIKIEAARRRLPEEISQIGNRLLDQLADTVRSKWSAEHKRDYANQIHAGETPEAFIYNFIVHTVGDKLESGQYHVYRGVLNEEGNQYKLLFGHAIEIMVDLGGYTKEWASTNLRTPVYKAIKEGG